MPDLDIDIVRGSGLVETTSGIEKRRVAKVYGFGDLTVDPDAREVAALNHPSMPEIGDVYSPLPALRLEQREVTANGPDLVEVTLTYRTPTFESLNVGDDAQVDIISNLETVRTDLDNQGNLITVDYNGSASGWDEIRQSVKEVRLQKPTFAVRYARRESISASALFSTAQTYNGRVNSTAFAGADPGQLLALITGRSDDGGDTFVVTYTFFYEEQTWDAVVVATDPETGQIPPDVATGNGRETYEIYPEANFNDLNL